MRSRIKLPDSFTEMGQKAMMSDGGMDGVSFVSNYVMGQGLYPIDEFDEFDGLPITGGRSITSYKRKSRRRKLIPSYKRSPPGKTQRMQGQIDQYYARHAWVEPEPEPVTETPQTAPGNSMVGLQGAQGAAAGTLLMFLYD